MDIRLVRGRNHRLWLWTLLLVGLGLIALVAAALLGDPTTRKGRASGASANFGAERAPVLPMQTEPFESALPLEDRELGRHLRLTGTAESQARANAVWVRTAGGRRILVRFEPSPPAGALRRFYPGSRVEVDGYLQRISRAELEAWLDSLGVSLPRAKPGVKFGDLPDSGFARIDSLFIKDYLVSVRPEGIVSARGGAPPPPVPVPAVTRPASEVRTPPATTTPPPVTEPRPAPAESAAGTTPATPPDSGAATPGRRR